MRGMDDNPLLAPVVFWCFTGIALVLLIDLLI